MGDISEPIRDQDTPEIEKVFDSLPVTLNVGFPASMGGPGLDTTVIGWSHAYRNKKDGCTTIVMSLDPEASEKLQNFAEVFDIKAIGFAGLKRRSQ